jgi:hypothetical protein
VLQSAKQGKLLYGFFDPSSAQSDSAVADLRSPWQQQSVAPSAESRTSILRVSESEEGSTKALVDFGLLIPSHCSQMQ